MVLKGGVMVLMGVWQSCRRWGSPAGCGGVWQSCRVCGSHEGGMTVLQVVW